MQGRYFPNVIFICDNHEDSTFQFFLNEITPVMQGLGPFYKENNPFTVVSKQELPSFQSKVYALVDQTNHLFIYPVLSKELDATLYNLSLAGEIERVNVFADLEKAKNEIINLIHKTALLNQRPSPTLLSLFKSTAKAIENKEKGVAISEGSDAAHTPTNRG